MGSTKQDVKASGASAPPRRSAEFKRDAVRLVVEEGYTFEAAAKAVHVPRRLVGKRSTAIRRVLCRSANAFPCQLKLRQIFSQAVRIVDLGLRLS